MNHKPKFKRLAFIITMGVFFASCISNVEELDESIDVDPDLETKVSFKDDVKPIIDSKCTVCHSPSGGFSPSLTNFSEVKARANRVQARVSNGTMPQSGPLPDAQIKVIVDWVNEGALDN